ncbi:MAG TPA: helix-turn-helix domain-containing protein, partial [Anaerolineales bacterium]|nr:helix-turn-helix domain-containing protein [Anaerolineales bacterium]
MPSSDRAIPLKSFPTFGDLLKYLRRRARLTQRELSIAVGYSEAQISRLEQNQRPPDLASLTALFIPALYIDDEPLIVTRLMELAAQARGEQLPRSGTVTFSRSVHQEIGERVTTVEEETRSNLPLQLTSFIGREREINEINNLLSSESKNKSRLVTLTGPGGCGKTRLALQVAMQLVQSYRDGVWLAELASTSRPEHIPQTIITSLEMPKPREGSESLGITKYLRSKHLLLILDNCEHVLPEVARLTHEILRSCPQVQVLATSREILNLPGEIRFRVPSLSVTEFQESGDDLRLHSEAVQLFVERAQATFPNFRFNKENAATIAQICRRLDGMPLAIELAAARVNTLSIEQIAERLDQSFQILSGGAEGLPHHQTLEATIEWSYDLLSDSERALLHRLSVFVGGWTLGAAESVASDPTFISGENVLDLLSQLVNKSLVVVDFQTRGETRYHLLEAVRQFSLNRLKKSAEHEQVKARHFDFFLSLVEAAEAGTMSARSPYWLERLDLEHDNLRAALEYGHSAKRYQHLLR